jgi:hypothetical protein
VSDDEFRVQAQTLLGYFPSLTVCKAGIPVGQSKNENLGFPTATTEAEPSVFSRIQQWSGDMVTFITITW